MAHSLPNFVPVELSAKPPENGHCQEAKCPKLYIFSRIRLQGIVNRATLKKLNHKILGRAKATTVHNTEQEGAFASSDGLFQNSISPSSKGKTGKLKLQL